MCFPASLLSYNLKYKMEEEKQKVKKEYPDIPVFAKNIDKKGRRYFTAYSNKTSNAVIHLGDKNTIIEGNPKIRLRLGESEFGEEFVFELLRTGKITQTPKNSKYDSVEIYLPKDFGLDFFERALAFFKRKNNPNNNENPLDSWDDFV